jgi:hypothetical protein
MNVPSDDEELPLAVTLDVGTRGSQVLAGGPRMVL